jgi:signal transduction histidine kinase
MPYYQAERYFTGQVPGMGLGLPTVATLVSRVGGTVYLRNRSGGPGVVVEFTSPIVETRADDRVSASA